MLFIKKILKKYDVNINILKWVKNYKLKNIQEQARLKRYELLFKKCKNYKLNKILSDNTKKTVKMIENDTNRDKFMSAQEALDYGLLDEIVKQKK